MADKPQSELANTESAAREIQGQPAAFAAAVAQDVLKAVGTATDVIRFMEGEIHAYNQVLAAQETRPVKLCIVWSPELPDPERLEAALDLNHHGVARHGVFRVVGPEPESDDSNAATVLHVAVTVGDSDTNNIHVRIGSETRGFYTLAPMTDERGKVTGLTVVSEDDTFAALIQKEFSQQIAVMLVRAHYGMPPERTSGGPSRPTVPTGTKLAQG